MATASEKDGMSSLESTAQWIKNSSFLYKGSNVGSQRSTGSHDSQQSDDSRKSAYAVVVPVDINNKKGDDLQSHNSNTQKSENANKRQAESTKTRHSDTSPPTLPLRHSKELEDEMNRDKNPQDSFEEPEPVYTDPDGEETSTDVPQCFFQRGIRMTTYPVPHQHGDEIGNKSKTGCSFKKICKYLSWIMTCLGISVLISLTTLNNKKTSELTSISNKVPEVSFFKKQEEDIHDIKNLLSLLKGKIFENSNPEANTSKICVDNCTLHLEGDFQSCQTCFEYITCSNGILYSRNCSAPLVWDDKQKTCTYKSSTC